MNESGLVSVVITTYNRRQYLKAAIESVLAQDYEEKDIIVVDDGSRDGSEEELLGLPVRYAWKANGGISSARNFGISLAKGDFIAFLDADDLWKKGKLSTQMRLMREEASLMSYTDEIWIRNGTRLNQGRKHRKYSGLIYSHCLSLCIISPSSAVISRQIFDAVGLFDESLPVCEDYDMWLRITCRYAVLFVDKPLIIKHGGHSDRLRLRARQRDLPDLAAPGPHRARARRADAPDRDAADRSGGPRLRRRAAAPLARRPQVGLHFLFGLLSERALSSAG